MSETFVLTRNITAMGETIQSRISISSGAGYKVDESIPGSTANREVALVIDVSQLKAIYIQSDVALSLFFNEASTGSPSKTIVLPANESFSWDILSGHANPFGATDVTKVFATKAGAGAAQLKILVLTDPTV